jgi:acyl carrier protein
MDGNADVVLNYAIDAVNELLPEDRLLSKSTNTVLLGESGELDSMGFVNLVAAVEEQLERQFGIRYALVDEVMRIDGELTVGRLHGILERIISNSQDNV